MWSCHLHQGFSSFIFSRLVFSLLFHLLSSSLDFHLLLSFFSSCLLSRLVFSSLSLSVSLCLSLCLLLWWLLLCGVSVHFVSVCTFKTSPCMPAPRAHVETHCTHGGVLDGHTGEEGEGERGRGCRQFRLPKFAHVGLSRASEVHQSKHWILHIFSLKNRPRTTCCRFLQSLALSEGNKLSGMERTVCTSVSLRKSHCHGYSCRSPALVLNHSPLSHSEHCK